MDINQYDELSRFMKGVFLERPALPRYTTTWSVDTVLQFLKNSPDKTLLQLSCKLSMLFLLLSAQRCQTLHLIHLTDIKISDSEVCIAPRHVLKQSKPGHHLDMMRFKAFSDDNKLCIVSVFKEYLTRTKPLRNTEKLLISTVKPHKEVSKSTIARWIKLVMFKAGIDTAFAPHSTRAAATSKAKSHGIPLNTIIRTAGWSSMSVFGKFYDKPIKESSKTLQEAVLEGL